jgi:hypothetical protein
MRRTVHREGGGNQGRSISIHVSSLGREERKVRRKEREDEEGKGGADLE